MKKFKKYFLHYKYAFTKTYYYSAGSATQRPIGFVPPGSPGHSNQPIGPPKTVGTQGNSPNLGKSYRILFITILDNSKILDSFHFWIFFILHILNRILVIVRDGPPKKMYRPNG